VSVRSGLISRVSGIPFTDFRDRLFKPLEHIVRAYHDQYIGDNVYVARHQHVAEMVFDRVLADAEARYDQIVRIMSGMNLDFNSDRMAFSQLVRGHGISESLRSRGLGRSFYDAATKVAPNEAFLFQQRAIFEMENEDLSQAEEFLKKARAIEPYNRSIQHSLAVLVRRQALATNNVLLRQRLRERAMELLGPLLAEDAEQAHGYYTAGQIALDDLRDLLSGSADSVIDASLERRIVDVAKDFDPSSTVASGEWDVSHCNC
jgi:tetratricopeptide (TPR) repeat protein